MHEAYHTRDHGLPRAGNQPTQPRIQPAAVTVIFTGNVGERAREGKSETSQRMVRIPRFTSIFHFQEPSHTLLCPHSTGGT